MRCIHPRLLCGRTQAVKQEPPVSPGMPSCPEQVNCGRSIRLKDNNKKGVPWWMPVAHPSLSLIWYTLRSQV